jgi:hypothetical protein
MSLDECVDWRLGRELASHEVKTARQMVGPKLAADGDRLARRVLRRPRGKVAIVTRGCVGDRRGMRGDSRA